MPCRDDAGPPYPAGQHPTQLVQKRLDEQAAEVCRLRGIICSLVENDVPLSQYRTGQEYQQIYKDQLGHRQLDKQRAIEDLADKLKNTKGPQTQQSILEQISKVTKVTSAYDLLTTDLF